MSGIHSQKRRNNCQLGILVPGSIFGLLGISATAHAANDLTWTGASGSTGTKWDTTDQNWVVTGTTTPQTAWLNGTGDTARFSTTTHGTTITIASSMKEDMISFENSPASFTFNSGSFNASSGGNIALQSSAGAGVTETINSPINFIGTGYAFNNSDTSSNSSINFGGAIGATNTTTQTTLSLNGTGTGTNTISGVVSNGTAGFKLGVTINAPTGNATIWKFTNSNTYTGITGVFGGTLIVANTSGSATGTGTINLTNATLASGTGNVGIISGAINAGSGTNIIAPGGLLGVGTLTENGALTTGTGTTLNFDLGTGTGVVTNGDQLILNATPSIATGTPLAFAGTPTAGVDYRLIGGTAASSITPGSFTLPTAPPTETYSLAYNTAVDPGYIDLVVGTAGPATLTWNDAGGTTANPSTWNTTDQNWNSGTAATVYHEGDIVNFTDTNNYPTNPNAYSVTLNTTVHPKSVTVTTANAYTISGTGGIADVTSGHTPLSVTGTGSLTLGGSNTYTGGTTVGTGTDTAKLILSGTNSFPMNTPLTINTGATVQIAAHAGNSSNTVVSVVGALTNNGLIDVTNNDLIVRGGSLATINPQLISGYAGGTWAGTTGITSTTAKLDTTQLTTIGEVLTTAAGTLDGIPTLAGDVLLKYTYYGDANLDGAVDGSDYTLIDAAYNNNQSVAGGGSGSLLTGWQNGDFNYDGTIDGSDYTLIDNAFNTQGSTLGTNSAALIAGSTAELATSSVPEPTTLGLLGIGAIGLLGRRRRK